MEKPDNKFLLYHFLKEMESADQPLHKNNLSLLCAKVEKLLIECHSTFYQIPVIARFRQEDRGDLLLNIASLIDAISDLAPFEQSLQMPIQNASDTEAWIDVPLQTILFFFQRVSYQLTVWDDSKIKKTDAPTLNAFYRSYLYDLVEMLHLEFEQESWEKLVDFLEKVALLQALVPSYVYARFILINQQQYAEFRILSRQDQKADSTKGNDIAAQIYDRLCSVIQPDKSGKVDGSMQTLDEMMIGIKHRYSQQYMRKFGVIE